MAAAEPCFILEEYPYPVAAWATQHRTTKRREKGQQGQLGAQLSVAEEIRALQQAFLNRVPGETSDSDGDTAVGFLLADKSPAVRGDSQKGKEEVSIWLDSDDDILEMSASRENSSPGMMTTRAKRNAAAAAGESSSTSRGPDALQQVNRRVKRVERSSQGVSPARISPRGQSARVHNLEAMGGREDMPIVLDDCYAAGSRNRRPPASGTSRPRFPSQQSMGLRSRSHDVIDLEADATFGPKADAHGFLSDLDVHGGRSSKPRLQKVEDASQRPSLLSGASREPAGTSSAGFGKRRVNGLANPSLHSSDGRAVEGSGATSDVFGAAVELAAGARADASAGRHFFGGEALGEGATGESFFCVLCQNSVPHELTLEMPACSCRFCSFCLEPEIHTQLEAMALHVESGMHQGKATDPRVAAGGAGGSGRISLSPLRLSGEPGGGKEGNVHCPGCAAKAPPSAVKALAPVAYRALEGALKSAELIASQPLLACPSCGLRTLREASELPLGAVSCGVPEIDRTAPQASVNDTDEAGRPLSLAALQHRETHRFRCPQCTTVFCGSCARVPYHVGKTCTEQALWESRPSCRFCAERVEAPNSSLAPSPGSKGSGGQMAVRELRRKVTALGADDWWCVEKKDLQAVLEWASQVCQAPECQEKLKTACTRTHRSCGHPCGGVKKEAPCLPCLHEDCVEKSTEKEMGMRSAMARLQAAGPSGAGASSSAAQPPIAVIKLPCADDFCPICWVDPLGAAPSLLLSCGHVVHAACAKEKVQQGYPGPEISFAYLRCPVCPELMNHLSLVRDMFKPLQLKAKVDKLLEKRVEAEVGVQRAKPAKSSGRGRGGKAQAGEAGAGAGAGVDVAGTRADLARRCLFFECVRCKEPYFGGDRRCGEAAGDAGPGGGGGAGAGAGERPAGAAGGGGQGRGRGQGRDAAAELGREKQKQELVCGDCVAAEMRKNAREGGAAAVAGACQKGHGSGYVQYKCRYCCSPATFFCFGTTHFCNKCHTVRPDCGRDSKIPECRGGKDCPLGVPAHPPAPSEFCLGCALCRLEEDEKSA